MISWARVVIASNSSSKVVNQNFKMEEKQEGEKPKGKFSSEITWCVPAPYFFKKMSKTKYLGAGVLVYQTDKCNSF